VPIEPQEQGRKLGGGPGGSTHLFIDGLLPVLHHAPGSLVRLDHEHRSVQFLSAGGAQAMAGLELGSGRQRVLRGPHCEVALEVVEGVVEPDAVHVLIRTVGMTCNIVEIEKSIYIYTALTNGRLVYIL